MPFRVENRVHTLEGTGLGLSIVKNIIEKHNSQVHLDSEVGVGTTFWFDLAIQPSVDDAPSPSDPSLVAVANPDPSAQTVLSAN